jgi:hypothetical protein
MQDGARDLYQGPFTIGQDGGWYTVLTTTPAAGYTPNFGMGMVGYTWEECGPSKRVRSGKLTLADAVEAMAAKPFADVLYIRCDWRHVQAQPHRLALHPVWDLTLDAARRFGRRMAFRVQMSNPSFHTGEPALPAFLRDSIPMLSIGCGAGYGGAERFEPKYDDPGFLRAFAELQDLLAARFDGDPAVEFVDLMMYGFWGEGHTGTYGSAYSDGALAERTFVKMAEMQLERWRRTPLAVNMQPDISRVGNDAVQALALDAGEWMRTDSIILDEPQQLERIGGRPPSAAAVVEDGWRRDYGTDAEYLRIPEFAHAGADYLENAMRHALDAGANYWALWLEADNVERYFERNPAAYDALRRSLGYRVRPAWVWQRKRRGGAELVVGVANHGVAGVPGRLKLILYDGAGTALDCGLLEAGQPAAGRLCLASLTLPEGFSEDLVYLRAELVTKGVARPVAWACAEPADGRGGAPVRLLPGDSPLWRKDI